MVNIVNENEFSIKDVEKELDEYFMMKPIDIIKQIVEDYRKAKHKKYHCLGGNCL